jgi:alkylglycerol monooxygenase
MDDHRSLAVLALLALWLPISLELLYARRPGRLPGVLASLWCGLLEQSLGAGLYLLGLAAYRALHTLSPTPWPQHHPLTWLGGVLLVDLVFYAYHRFSHQTALGWALHQVHHQLEDLHLAAAVRNSPLGGLLQMGFLAPLALLGLPPAVLVLAKAINPLYQLGLHTRLVGPLGGLDLFLNTPSNHRVHHGVEPWCRDRNFGGLLMVWDHLFGTWQRELREPTYGVDPSFRRLDPVLANAAPLRDLARLVRQRGWAALLGPPVAGEDLGSRVRPVSPLVSAWVIAQTAGAVLLLAWALSGTPSPDRLILGAVALSGGSSVAAWLEGRPWAPWLDGARLLAAVAAYVL